MIEPPTILITGASRGLGLGLVDQFEARGAHVVAAVRSPSAQDMLVGRGVEAEIMDVSSDLSVQDAAYRLAGRRFDVLICNAAIYGPARQSSFDMDYAGFADVFNTNCIGALRVIQAFLPMLRRSDSPKIAVISSTAGSMASKSLANNALNRVAYRASKAALNKITQNLAYDYRSLGICVVAINPGWIRTDMGGANAIVPVTTSAICITDMIDGLSMEDSGKFFDYSGQPLSW